MRTTILGTFFMASATEIEEGVNWYLSANRIACMMAHDYNISIPQAAAVIAALSPQNPWERNVKDAISIVQLYTSDGKDAALAYKCGTFGINKRKAVECLEVYELHKLDAILNGRKVVAFFHNIIGDPEYVCVDGHAYSIWLGERVSTSDTPKITPKLYETISQDYKEATAKINQVLGTKYHPYQVQAITWVTHRNLHKGQRKRHTNKR